MICKTYTETVKDKSNAELKTEIWIRRTIKLYFLLYTVIQNN